MNMETQQMAEQAVNNFWTFADKHYLFTKIFFIVIAVIILSTIAGILITVLKNLKGKDIKIGELEISDPKAKTKKLSKSNTPKITINDITNDCGINRQTFYYHFKDIYDLLEWIFANEVVKKIEKETTIKNWQENFKYVLDYMLENKKFIIKTYNSLSRKTLLDFLFKQYNTIFIDIINDVSKNYNITKENKIFIANFYKYGFAGVIENWIVT